MTKQETTTNYSRLRYHLVYMMKQQRQPVLAVVYWWVDQSASLDSDQEKAELELSALPGQQDSPADIPAEQQAAAADYDVAVVVAVVVAAAVVVVVAADGEEEAFDSKQSVIPPTTGVAVQRGYFALDSSDKHSSTFRVVVHHLLDSAVVTVLYFVRYRLQLTVEVDIPQRSMNVPEQECDSSNAEIVTATALDSATYHLQLLEVDIP